MTGSSKAQTPSSRQDGRETDGRLRSYLRVLASWVRVVASYLWALVVKMRAVLSRLADVIVSGLERAYRKGKGVFAFALLALFLVSWLVLQWAPGSGLLAMGVTAYLGYRAYSGTEPGPTSSGSGSRFFAGPPDSDFDDVAGMKDLKETLSTQVIEPRHGDGLADQYGDIATNGILLYGPPGTGKTHVATCLAGELGVNFANVSAGDIVSRWTGDAANVKSLFAEARTNAPCIVFIDEIDSLATSRSGDEYSEKREIVNQLLGELSEVNSEDDIVVIGATNAIETVDDAMLRPGRFDTKIEVPRPDGEARVALYEHYMCEIDAPSESVDRARFVRRTRGLTASAVEEVVTRAAQRAYDRAKQRNRRETITRDDVFEAVDAVSDEQGATGEFVRAPPAIDFDDVVGMDDLKSRLRTQVIKPRRADDLADRYGDISTNGILLYGPPGTGKTHVATCLAGQMRTNFANVSAGDVVSEHTSGADAIKRLFAEARESAPCLVFIDEIDSLGGDRSADGQTGDKREVVTQLLDELSRVNSNDDIVVVGATNTVEALDDALLRTGRFDAKVEIPRPDGDARWMLFEHYLAVIDAPTANVDRPEFIQDTSGFTASGIEEVVTRAAQKAYTRAQERREQEAVSEADVFEAIDELNGEQGRTGEFIEAPPAVDFNDVAGMDDLKEEFRRRIIDPLENPEMYDEYGISIENGILLYGPPGTGKTHTTRCLAGELDVNFIDAKAGDLVSKYVGEGAKNVQRMFEEARRNEPCLVFVDEIDALATSRGERQQQSERQLVNQFLEEVSDIDGEDADVIVVAATNRRKDIDEAMLRSGRLSTQIEVSAPDAEARTAIFRHHLQAPVERLDEGRLAGLTEGFVAADMEHLADAVARRAMERARRTDDGGADSQGVVTADVETAVGELQARSR